MVKPRRHVTEGIELTNVVGHEIQAIFPLHHGIGIAGRRVGDSIFFPQAAVVDSGIVNG